MEKPAFEFTSEDSFPARGHRVYTGHAPTEIPVHDTVGRLVLIDGKLMRVLGVDWCLVPSHDPLPVGHRVGLLAEELARPLVSRASHGVRAGEE